VIEYVEELLNEKGVELPATIGSHKILLPVSNCTPICCGGVPT